MSEYKKWERPPKIKTEGVITTCIAIPTSRYIDAEWLLNFFDIGETKTHSRERERSNK